MVCWLRKENSLPTFHRPCVFLNPYTVCPIEFFSVSKLPVFDPWMIFCCNAMRAEMTETDHLVFDDEKDTLLTVNYRLPRDRTGPRARSG